MSDNIQIKFGICYNVFYVFLNFFINYYVYLLNAKVYVLWQGVPGFNCSCMVPSCSCTFLSYWHLFSFAITLAGHAENYDWILWLFCLFPSTELLAFAYANLVCWITFYCWPRLTVLDLWLQAGCTDFIYPPRPWSWLPAVALTFFFL